ncbi:MAG TPA: PspC domain-containing protein [Steroidobacteraceae bacterium]|nr:PspC domain-containing protein [Steroidobacteraceae bacterium]
MERISVTVRLNGRNVLQFDAAAYQRLEAYLAESEGLLEGDPDPAEIMNDLEQAIADRCTQRLAPDRPVVTLVELEAALDEIGTVQVAGSNGSVGTASTASTARPAGAQPLRQHSQGALISGVCLGLARYVGLDVTWIRIVTVVLVLLTGGGALVVYAALMLLLPYAPLEPDGPEVGWLPGKCREFVEFLRARLSGGTVTTS